MKDKLSYRQLYDEIEALNASAFDSLLNGDFEGFQNTVDEFTDSGIMEQEEFAAAREAYRYASMPFTLDGIWISVDSRNPLNRLVIDVAGPSIRDLHERDVMPVYAYLTEQEETALKENKLSSQRASALEEYKELYKNLYTDVVPKWSSTASPVGNLKNYQITYINRITELAAVRSKFYMTYDFTCLPVNNMWLIDNEKLKKMETHEKIDYLTKTFDNLYDHTKNKNRFKTTNCFSFDGYEKILVSNYLQGKNIDRKNWKHYTKGILPKIPEFYLELAFYLTIPSSAEIERFMNLHGYSIKKSMMQFGDACIGNQPILHRDLCKWIDAGIDYNLLNEICGLELEKKEIRKKSN